MSTRFDCCPSCGKAPTRGMLGRATMDIYECTKCKRLSCYQYCGDRCPKCGAAGKKKIGYCPSE